MVRKGEVARRISGPRCFGRTSCCRTWHGALPRQALCGDHLDTWSEHEVAHRNGAHFAGGGEAKPGDAVPGFRAYGLCLRALRSLAISAAPDPSLQPPATTGFATGTARCLDTCPRF